MGKGLGTVKQIIKLKCCEAGTGSSGGGNGNSPSPTPIPTLTPTSSNSSELLDCNCRLCYIVPTLLFDNAINTEYQFQLSRYTGNSNCSYPTTEGIKDIDKKILFFPDIVFQGISIMDNDDLINPALNNGKTLYKDHNANKAYGYLIQANWCKTDVDNLVSSSIIDDHKITLRDKNIDNGQKYLEYLWNNPNAILDGHNVGGYFKNIDSYTVGGIAAATIVKMNKNNWPITDWRNQQLPNTSITGGRSIRGTYVMKIKTTAGNTCYVSAMYTFKKY